MKLLLTSAGFENPRLGKEFIKLVGEPPSDIKIFMLSTQKSIEDKKWLDLTIKHMTDINLNKNNIKVHNIEKRVSFAEVLKYDSIYFCGGNTYFLLKTIRKTRFDEIIRKFIQVPKKVYVGISAGSIILGPDIELTKIHDENIVNLKNLKGLNIIDAAISPHYKNSDKKIIDEYRHKYKIITLTDKQALLVTDKGKKIVQ